MSYENVWGSYTFYKTKKACTMQAFVHVKLAAASDGPPGLVFLCARSDQKNAP